MTCSYISATVDSNLYNDFNVNCRELTPGTSSLTGDSARTMTVNNVRTVPIRRCLFIGYIIMLCP